VVLAVTLGGGDQFSVLENVLNQLAPDAIVTTRTDEVVAVVPASPHGTAGAVDRARTLAARCVADGGRRGVRVAAVGIGNPCRTAVDISRSYGEARRALTAGERMGEPGNVTLFAELGIHRLLLQFPDVAELRSFAHEVIGQLIEEQDTTGMEYIETLSVYFAENSSPSRAAQRLHVHPNTVSYRIRRIEEITGLSLDVHQDRLMAEVAVQILDGLGARR
jgi:DNA-binding PucR family transcriptional regulator